MVKKLYTRKIEYCMYCPDYVMERIPGKRYSGTICRRTRIYIATETKDAPTPEEEKDSFKKSYRFPPFCPLEDCE
jgi:hypothetical protein